MPNTYTELRQTVVGTATSSVTLDLTGISGYTDLELVGTGTINTGTESICMRFNSDTGSNYSFTYLIGNGGSAFSGRASNTTFALAGALDASTIGNFLVKINSYSNSNVNKTVLSRRNISSSYTAADVSLWRNTAAITSITLFPENSKTFSAGSTFSLYGISNLGDATPKATGGIVTSDATYWYHTFEMSGNFIPNQSLTCDYLVLAGGGGGGVPGGGGGAGGYRSSVTATGGGGTLPSALSLTAQTYQVLVGGGGAVATSGAPSSFATVSTSGGGRGGALNQNGTSGGSGGGAGANSAVGASYSGGGGTLNEGYGGGSTPGSGNSPSGGGGGAGGVGGNGNPSGPVGGIGGVGVASVISGTSITRGGGGGGSVGIGSVAGTASGGGGAGGSGFGNATSGTQGTGGGGGGASQGAGGQGGSGIVIVRYAK
jgi:hypothetical protein